MSNYILFILFFTTGLFSLHGFEQDDLQGDWDLVKEELEDGRSLEEVSLDDNPVKTKLRLTFKKSFVDIYENGKTTKGLKFKQDTDNKKRKVVSFGNRVYIVEKLTKNEMILLEDKIFASRLFFRRRT